MATPQPIQHQLSLSHLEHDLFEMASRAEVMFMQAVQALVEVDVVLARQVMVSDDQVDRLDMRIESECLALLAGSQGGEDLRAIGAILKIITDIERVGDLSVDLARATLGIDRELGTATHVDIPRVAQPARTMFHTSIEAYARRQMELVTRVEGLEREVDHVYREMSEQIFDQMRAEPQNVVVLTNLLLAASNIERIADHALNISDRVAYMITGEVRTHNVQNA